MKKKILPALMAGAVIVLALLIILISALVKKYTPSKEVLSLSDYYGITEENQVAIIANYNVSESYARLADGEIYLNFDFIHSTISNRFYWDENENVLLYATSEVLYSAEANSTNYYKDKKSVSQDKIIVKPTTEGCYVSISFLKEFVDFTYEVFEEPQRIIFLNDFKDKEIASIKKNCKLRKEPSIKSPIVTSLSKGEEITFLEEQDGWTKLMTANGVIGFVESKRVGDSSTVSLEHTAQVEEFSHILRNTDVCLGWHLVESRGGSESAANVLSSVKGINVISPTWFKLKDAEGNVSDIASEDYVKYCRNQGVEVWALVSDFESEEYYGKEVLTRTSSRQYLENQLIAKALSYNLDGINIDFEKIQADFADDFIQFIRELAIKCHKNGISLSVDSYMPASWNTHLQFEEQALFADYVVLMGYDEHWDGSEPGSVSSLGWVKSGVETTLQKVPSNQIILAMPFYTRMWKYTPNADIEESDIIDLETSYTMSSKAYTMSGISKVIGEHVNEAVWDDAVNQFYLEYKEDNCIYKVWLETLESLEGRLKVMDENNLGGCAFWRLGQEKSEVWDTIIKYTN